jgi:CRISPR-associated exonuclease Cas4
MITGTLIWYYYICPREVWLMSRQLAPWEENPFIELGRIISQESYERDTKEVQIENIVIDIVKTQDEKVIIGEVKKSSRFIKSATMQLAFYLLKLKEYGINAKGILLFPKEKRRIPLSLTKEMEEELNLAIDRINQIIKSETPPPATKNKFCAKCGYKEFCWA